MYIRPVNLTDDDKVMPDGSQSYNFAVSEGNFVIIKTEFRS